MENIEKKSKPRSKEYPSYTLNQSIDFASRYINYPSDKPISYEVASKECGVSSKTKSFRYMLSSARQYGLIDTLKGETMRLQDVAKRLIRPTEDEETIRKIKIECFSSPKIYTDLILQYNGKSIPSVKTLSNVLANSYGIIGNVSESAAQTFFDSANEVGVVINGVLDTDASEPDFSQKKEEGKEKSLIINQPETLPPEKVQNQLDEPLTIPFGDKRKALLYMPLDTTKTDAEYVLEMIKIMFKNLYQLDKNE